MRIWQVVLLAALALWGASCASRTVDDAAIAAQVKSRLAADSDTADLKIGVEVKGGVVTLTGGVAAEIEKSKAEQIAKYTEGVAKVVNRLTVASSPSGAAKPEP